MMDRNAQRINEIKYFSILRNNYPTIPSLKSVKAINYLRFHVKYFSINLIFG